MPRAPKGLHLPNRRPAHQTLRVPETGVITIEYGGRFVSAEEGMVAGVANVPHAAGDTVSAAEYNRLADTVNHLLDMCRLFGLISPIPE